MAASTKDYEQATRRQFDVQQLQVKVVRQVGAPALPSLGTPGNERVIPVNLRGSSPRHFSRKATNLPGKRKATRHEGWRTEYH